MLGYWQVLKRRKLTLAVLVVLGGALGYGLTLLQTPIYEARLSLEIQNLNEDFMNMRSVDPTQVNYAAETYLQTQVKILQSESLLRRAVERLELQKYPGALPAEGRLRRWWDGLRGAPPEPKRPEREIAMDIASQGVAVRGTGLTRLIEIRSEWPNPHVAADLANLLAREFISQNLETRWKTTQDTGDWLRVQLRDMKEKLERSEAELDAYARTSGLQPTTGTESMDELKLKQLQIALSAAYDDRVAKQARFDQINTAPADSLPVVLDDMALRDFQIKLADLRRQVAEAASTMSEEHPKHQRLVAQVQEMETAFRRHRDNIIERIRNEYRSAQRRENLLLQEYQKQNREVTDLRSKAIRYNIMRREVESNRQIYDGMLQRVREAGVASAVRASHVRIVDPAMPPKFPSRPSRRMYVGFGLLGGVFVGFCFILWREANDPRLKQPGEAAQKIGIRELGIIPKVAELNGPVPSIRARNKLLRIGPQTAAEPSPAARVWSDSFHATSLSLRFSMGSLKGPKVIVVTSPNPGEGKSTTVANLAMTMAEHNRKVLLIDCDLRRPHMHTLFKIPRTPGLADLLMDWRPEDPLDVSRWTHATSTRGLYVMPAGRPLGSVTSVLQDPLMSELLLRMRQEFDSILIDTPPVLPIPDARVIGALGDAVVLVFRSGQTSRESAAAAVRQLAEDGAPLIGCVLSGWDVDSADPNHYAYQYKAYTDRNG